MRKTKCHFWVPFHFIQLRFFGGEGAGAKLELLDTGRTARTRGHLDLNSVARKCDTSVRKSCSEISSPLLLKACHREKVLRVWV